MLPGRGESLTRCSACSSCPSAGQFRRNRWAQTRLLCANGAHHRVSLRDTVRGPAACRLRSTSLSTLACPQCLAPGRCVDHARRKLARFSQPNQPPHSGDDEPGAGPGADVCVPAPRVLSCPSHMLQGGFSGDPHQGASSEGWPAAAYVPKSPRLSELDLEARFRQLQGQ
jgi:hypothetical protein